MKLTLRPFDEFNSLSLWESKPVRAEGTYPMTTVFILGSTK